MSFPSFIILQASYKSPFLLISFLHPLSSFIPIQPTSLLLCLSAILSFLDLAHSHWCSLLSICIPTHISCELTFSLQLPPAITNCSHLYLNQLLFLPLGNNATKWPRCLSFSSHRMKSHSNHFNSVLEKVVSKFATEVRLFCPNPQHVHLELRGRNFLHNGCACLSNT